MFRQKSSHNIITKMVENEDLSQINREQPNGDFSLYSPISQIVRGMNNSLLSEEFLNNYCEYSGDFRNDEKWEQQKKRTMDSHEIAIKSCNAGINKLLFKNVFKIRGTPESAVKIRSSRRSVSMASRRLSSPEPLSLLIDKENGSASCSPLAQHFSPLKMGNEKLKYSRLPLEDFDPNTHDSDFGKRINLENTLENRSNRKINDVFRFAEPSGVAPRRISFDSRGNSPLICHFIQRQNSSPLQSYHSSLPIITNSSGYGSMDDGFNELCEMDTVVENENQQQPVLLPNGINDLLSGNIVSLSNEKPMECDGATTPEFPRVRQVRVRRSLSMQIDHEDNSSNVPSISKVRACLFRSPNATSSAEKLTFNENYSMAMTPSPVGVSFGGIRKKIFASPEDSPESKISAPFKRPEPPSDGSPILVKRSRKTVSFRTLPESSSLDPSTFSYSPSGLSMEVVERKNIDKIPLNRCLSESDAHEIIKSAIHRSTTDADLTGDFSRTCILPLAEGHHDDLKSISADTLAKLIHGEFNHCIDEFQIVDCRYPYEYEAGHIENAINLYTKELIEEFITNPLNKIAVIEPEDKKRNILIFHCEFSWERGPNLSRYLRNIDRKLNKESYPALHFPEVYLLHGGYQQFFRLHKNLCWPQGYRPMDDPDHEADLRKFRSKSKSWQGEKSRTNSFTARVNLKRLGL